TTGSWLSAVPSSSGTPFTLTVSANAGQLAVGTYNGTITFSSPAAANVVIPVTLIIILPASVSKVGVFRQNFQWILDANGNQAFDGTGTGQDIVINNFVTAVAGDIPVNGDWNGSGTTKIGIYRPSTGQWFLDYNGNGIFDTGDKTYNFGGISGDVPVVGD